MACRMAVRLIVLLAGLVLTSAHALADVVVPSPDVTTRVIVRASASSQSAQIGSLRPGEQLELIGSVPNWHEVRLPSGAQGFVSKRWTVVVPTTPPAPTPAAAAATFTIDVVDVGTGLGILVRGPDFTLIYDGGSNDDLARGPDNRMLAYLKAVAPTLTTINHLVLSHKHRDHVELLPDLFGAYQIEQVWDSGRINDICGYRAFLTAVRDEPTSHTTTPCRTSGRGTTPSAGRSATARTCRRQRCNCSRRVVSTTPLFPSARTHP
jgi:beta-lactamase superfamily II metal-dependent hydrolase